MVCANCAPGPRDHPAPPGLVKSLAAATALAPSTLSRLRLPLDQIRGGLAFLSVFWQEIVGNDLPSLALAARALASPFPPSGRAA